MPITSKVNKAGFRTVLARLKTLQAPIDRETAEALGEGVVSEMKDLIAKGISPIKGQGRFPKYKDTKKYPGGRKPNTPVNLNLTGEFQEALTYSVKKNKSGFETSIFYQGRRNDDKESGHREGSDGTKRTSRPTIPQGDERFAERIARIVSRIYRERIGSI